MSKLKKIGLVAIFILPAIIGCIGYKLQGLTIWDSAYGAARMYFFDADSENNIWLVEFARWIAPIVAVSGLALILKTIWIKIRDFFKSFHSDAVAVYGDVDYKEIMAENVKHALIVDSEEVIDVKNHIIMFSSDEKSLEFYEKNKGEFHGEVFIKLDKNDSFSVCLEGVKFFNINEITAKNFWKERDVRQVIKKEEMKIAIAGSDILSRKILEYGLLNNVFSLNQKIEYHLWSDSDTFKKVHSDFQTMNGDSVIYEDNSAQDRLFKIASADRIIITEKIDNEFIYELTKLTKGEIYCFDPVGTFVNIFDYEKIYPFGSLKDVLCEENIKTDNLYKAAKKLNYAYALKYPEEGKETPTEEEAWEKLNTFTKASNIASADFLHTMLVFMKETGRKEVDDVCGELEHIRWSRFHFMHHFRYGETENGKKDEVNKIHPCLKPYCELDSVNKSKDIDGIKTLLEVNG